MKGHITAEQDAACILSAATRTDLQLSGDSLPRVTRTVQQNLCLYSRDSDALVFWRVSRRGLMINDVSGQRVGTVSNGQVWPVKKGQIVSRNVCEQLENCAAKYRSNVKVSAPPEIQGMFILFSSGAGVSRSVIGVAVMKHHGYFQ